MAIGRARISSMRNTTMDPVADPALANWTTSYYAPRSGIGSRLGGGSSPVRAGPTAASAVGIGAGTLACYAQHAGKGLALLRDRSAVARIARETRKSASVACLPECADRERRRAAGPGRRSERGATTVASTPSVGRP